MPIPTGPRPNNRPPQGNGGEQPEVRLPVPNASNTQRDGQSPYEIAQEDPFAPIPFDEVGNPFDDFDEEEDLLPRRHRNVSPRTVEDDGEDDLQSEIDSLHEEEREEAARDNGPINFEKEPEEEKESEPVSGRKKSKNRKEQRKTAIKAGYTEDTFIDEETKTLKPFGRGQGRKAKVGEFDNRKNMRNQQKMVQTIFVSLAVLAVLLGLYRVLVPPKTLTEADVLTIVAAQTGDTGFPTQQGQSFAQEFMKAYLSNDNSPITQRVLSYYYSGKMDGTSVDSATQIPSNGFKQRIIYGPTVYSSTPIDANSAAYVVGALVEPSGQDSKAPADGSAAKWIYFSVNVYYDKATNSFAIPKDSPSIVPPTSVVSSTDMPQPKPIGNGQPDETLKAEISSVITGFVKGYAVSSPEDHSGVDQYIDSTSNTQLTQGLNSQFQLAGEGEEAISITAYPTDTPGVVKAQVKVSWQSKVNDTVNNTYASSYVATLQKQTNGKYLVVKFAPEYYVPESKG